MTGAPQVHQPAPDVSVTPSGMMHLVRWIGRDGAIALINMLESVRAGRRPHREDVIALEHALHTGLSEFFPKPKRGTGFPSKRQW